MKWADVVKKSGAQASTELRCRRCALFPGFSDAPDRDARTPRSIASSGATVRRCCCCTGIRRRTRCGIASRRRSRSDITVVCADLRGYGDSSKPAARCDARRVFEARDGRRHGRGDARRSAFARSGSSDTIAADASRIGCASIIRTRSSALAVLDISPTRTMYAQTDQAFATAYYHWFFLIQPFDLPERLIGADPAYYLRAQDRRLGRPGSRISIRARSPSTSAASATRRRSMRRCEDYRAAASIDLEHDARRRAKRKVECPLLVLWGDKGVVHRLFDPLARLARRRRRRARTIAAAAATISPRKRRRRRCAN